MAGYADANKKFDKKKKIFFETRSIVLLWLSCTDSKNAWNIG